MDKGQQPFCPTTCHHHEDTVKWKDKIDGCLFDNKDGMLVQLTKVIETLATVQKVVYAAVAFGLLAFGTSVVKLLGGK